MKEKRQAYKPEPMEVFPNRADFQAAVTLLSLLCSLPSDVETGSQPSLECVLVAYMGPPANVKLLTEQGVRGRSLTPHHKGCAQGRNRTSDHTITEFDPRPAGARAWNL
jgi:hypothetical protein